MFSKDIKLKDWEIQASGIDDVLEANRQIFNSVRDIDVRVLRKYEDGNAVVSELEINVNNGEEITLVVDVIEFDDNGNIANIRAYKG